MGSLRKYVNGRVIGSALAVLPVIRATRKPKLGIRVPVLWIAWAAGAVIAVVTTRETSQERTTR